MGEELSGLTIRDLQFLQSQIEMSLQSVRKKKVTPLNIICGTMSPYDIHLLIKVDTFSLPGTAFSGRDHATQQKGSNHVQLYKLILLMYNTIEIDKFVHNIYKSILHAHVAIPTCVPNKEHMYVEYVIILHSMMTYTWGI